MAKRKPEIPASFKKVIEQLRPVGAREALSNEDSVSLNGPERSAGPARPRKAPPKAFLDREKAETVTESWGKGIRPPTWLIELRKRRATFQEVFDEALRQLRRRPGERNFRLTQMTLNEIARMEGGSEFVLSKITQTLLDEFLVKGD